MADDIENNDIENDVPWDVEEEESWPDGSAGAASNEEEDDSGPINPLAGIFESGKYDTDKVPDNPNVVPKGTYECELKSVKIEGPETFEGKNKDRMFIRLTFMISDPSTGFLFKTVRKKIFMPTVEEMNMEKPPQYAQELADKMRQAYNRLGVPRSEYTKVNLQDYVGRSYKVGWQVMTLPDDNQINTVNWFNPIQ